MYLEVTIGQKWKKSYEFTAYQLAHDWRNSFPSLKNAIGCKVYIIDLRKGSKVEQKSVSDLRVVSYRAKKGILFRSGQLN